MKQRGENRLRRENSGVEARDIGADAHRRIADAPQRRGVFGHRLHDEFGAGTVTKRTFFAERSYRTIDQFGIRVTELRVIETECFGCTSPEIFDDHVGITRQSNSYFAARLRIEIEHDAFLVAIETEENGALIVR